MKKGILIAVGVVAVVAVVLVGLVASQTVIFFRHGMVFSGSKEVTLAVEPDELPKLDSLRSMEKLKVTSSDGYDQIQAWAQSHPNITVEFVASLPSNVPVDQSSEVADLTGLDQNAAIELAKSSLAHSTNIKGIKIDAASWTPESLAALRQACPNIPLVGSYKVGNIAVELDATNIDLQSATVDELEAFAPLVGGMGNLQTINVGEEQGGHTKLHAVSVMRQANPNVAISYAFYAYGKRFDYNEPTLDFRHWPVTDGGTEVREVLSLMPHVTYLDLDTCGLDDETCAAIRNDFPNTEVVWRVWFGPGYTVRTDEERIFASNEALGSLSPENDQALKYCNKVKYLDLGHNSDLRDIWFVSYMPDLEVFICILGGITDISPLADCPHLEFLEIFSNSVSDLSPLANCHELKHLNCCNNPGISDISCLYDIDLERFWCGYPNSVPQEQFDQYQALHPNCTLRTSVSNPHEDFRGDNPRYLLLREQIGYDGLRFSTPENDPLWEGPLEGTSTEQV